MANVPQGMKKPCVEDLDFTDSMLDDDRHGDQLRPRAPVLDPSRGWQGRGRSAAHHHLHGSHPTRPLVWHDIPEADASQACTSIASAQMIATSSILSFDIYGTYINPTATNSQLIRWSHIGVVATSILISTLATAWHQGGVDMTWLLYVIGNLINPGVFPTVFALLWKRQTRAAAIAAPLVGMACGITVWLTTAYRYGGEISVLSTGATMPNLWGGVTSFFVPLPVTIIVSLVWPEEFEWAVFRRIEAVKVDGEAGGQEREQEETWFTPERVAYMKRMSRWAAFWSVFTILGHLLLWPLPMYGAKIVFSKPVSSSGSVSSMSRC